MSFGKLSSVEEEFTDSIDKKNSSQGELHQGKTVSASVSNERIFLSKDLHSSSSSRISSAGRPKYFRTSSFNQDPSGGRELKGKRLQGMMSLHEFTSLPASSFASEKECSSEGDLRSHHHLSLSRQSTISDSIEHFSILFSIPQLLVLSNVQDFISGGRSQPKPSIQPNEYMDNILYNISLAMKERGLNQLPLPDQDFGVELFDGQMTGLTNLSRRGNSLLHAEKDNIVLSFTLQARDLRAAYSWRKKRLKGTVVALLSRTIVNVQIKQSFSASKSPRIHLFQVKEVDGIQVAICGLGLFNWIFKKMIRSLLRRHIRTWIENDLKAVLQRELYNVSIGDELSCALFYNNESLYHPNKKVIRT